jgi:integrase/recombinase XerD
MNYNPAEGLLITRRAKRLPHDLLPMDELRTLYESYSGNVQRKLLLSLVIFQALRREELVCLRVEHLHLKEGKLVVPSTPSSNRRVLRLSTEQIMPFYEWTKAKSPHDRLFLSPQGSSNLNNVIQGLVYQLRAIHPEVKYLQQIRQSVIAHWLKSHDVRQVQYMAGHKWVSSTERYQQTDLEDLQNKLDKYHPLG